MTYNEMAKKSSPQTRLTIIPSLQDSHATLQITL